VQEPGTKITFDFSLSKIKTRDIILMTSQLGTMLSAGLSILRCFNVLEKQTASRKLRDVIQRTKTDIEQGVPLWEAMSKHPHVFPPVYTSMIRAGELGGVLEEILERLRDHLEREQHINAKIKSASVYPVFISIITTVIVFAIVAFVVPVFAAMFQSTGVELPAPTRMMLSISNYLQEAWLYLLFLVIIVVIGLKSWGKTPSGRLIYDKIYLHLPLVGKVVSRITLSRFTRTMGTLVKSGIPVLQALEIVEKVVNNAVIARAIAGARSSIREGQSIAGPLEKSGVFDPMITNMIAVGEETGALDDMLIKMAEYFEREVMYSIETLMALIEPAMILVVAIIVGGVVLASLLPVFELMNVIGI